MGNIQIDRNQAQVYLHSENTTTNIYILLDVLGHYYQFRHKSK